ncbi:hypothetical protein CDAR_564271 [Caerostris darwini]|uniref:Uncharacterized protein n=1 Tax=Caerostris darwini TaxID=1538125 RepID=A0AAV4VKB0_9ARAC|nr:hypothetical protein CDAR_564271 [Caerostris darwini]
MLSKRLPSYLVSVSYRTQFFFLDVRPTSLHFTSDAAMNFSTSRSGAANKLRKTMSEEEEEKEKRKEGSDLGSFGILFIAAVKLSGNATMNIVS